MSEKFFEEKWESQKNALKLNAIFIFLDAD